MGLHFIGRPSLIKMGKLWILYKSYKEIKQRIYVRPVYTCRKQLGEFYTLIKELRLIANQNYFKYF